MSVYAQSVSGKESWKMIQDPRKNLDPLQKLTDLSLAHRHSSLKMSSGSAYNFLKIFCTQTQTTTKNVAS